ncbi:hypothetical protein ACET3Z_032949 [Daucus carota]
MQGLNGLKYFATIVAVTTRTAYSRSHSDEWYKIAWVASGVAAASGTYWDLVLDWGLLQRNSKNRWLRDKLLIPHHSVYFGAMFWTSESISFLHKETLITIVASLEIIRRGIWNFFRLENEHLNNVGEHGVLDEKVLGSSAHSDYGMMTLLVTDGVPGLQVCREKTKKPQVVSSQLKLGFHTAAKKIEGDGDLNQGLEAYDGSGEKTELQRFSNDHRLNFGMQTKKEEEEKPTKKEA